MTVRRNVFLLMLWCMVAAPATARDLSASAVTTAGGSQASAQNRTAAPIRPYWEASCPWLSTDSSSAIRLVGLFDSCGDDCGAIGCASEGCDDCRPCFMPTMIGDTGLGIPQLQAVSAGTQAVFQDHIYKVAENNSPLPQDRIGVNVNFAPRVYNGYSDGFMAGDDIFEYRFFIEKTLFDERLSVDFMVPFYQTSTRDLGDTGIALNGPGTATSFGDIAFGLKYLLHRSERSALSVGVRVETPTGKEIFQPDPGNIWYTSASDDVWHFTPYAGIVLEPTDRVFVQSFLGYRMNTGSLDRPDPFVSLRDQDLFTADLSVGYWLYRSPNRRGLTGIVPTLELHYTGSFESAGPRGNVSNGVYANSDILNLTAGVTAFVNERCSITAGLAVPLRDNPTSFPGLSQTIGSDRRFDSALMLNVNYYFGR
jgi:hypothetical protein